jgi:hypothetical protein
MPDQRIKPIAIQNVCLLKAFREDKECGASDDPQIYKMSECDPSVDLALNRMV